MEIDLALGLFWTYNLCSSISRIFFICQHHTRLRLEMARVTISREYFLADRQGRTFSDVANDPEVCFQTVLDFFNEEGRQRRMEESEIHHDRPPLAGVVRELESLPSIDKYLAFSPPSRAKRLRQAVGVIVRMVMEQLGWTKTGKKGSLGVRVAARHDKAAASVPHNTGGLALWFLRAERYARPEGMPFLSVRDRVQQSVCSRSLPRGDGMA